jgi:hypothetical protein
MPIARENGFLLSHDAGLGTRIGIESSKLNECVEYARHMGIHGMFGAPCFGFHESDLDFLAELPWMEDVWLWDINLRDINGLYQLEGLRYLGVEPKRPPIDFSRFTHLHTAVFTPQKKDCGLEELRGLEILHIWHFRSKENTFASLRLPNSLKELQLNWASPESLETLQALEHLKSLEIHRCRNLKSIGNLAGKYPALEHLVIETCGKLAVGEAAEAIRAFPNLAHAFVQNTKLV